MAQLDENKLNAFIGKMRVTWVVPLACRRSAAPWLTGIIVLKQSRLRRRHHARYSTSIQPLRLWDHSSWINVSYCGWDCERTHHRSRAISIPLAAVVANLMGGNASIRAVCCSLDSRLIDLSDKRGVNSLRRCEVRPT